EWTGYKVYLTQTCDDDRPNLNTDVTTRPASTADFEVLPTSEDQLAERKLVPKEQVVVSGYVTAADLLSSRNEAHIELLGPVAQDHSWQAKAGEGFAAAQFVIDWQAKEARCPQGERRVIWLERSDRHGHASVQTRFSKPVCGACACRASCTASESGPRTL